MTGGEYIDVDMEALDIDWFGTSRTGQLAQFTTGGLSSLPAKIRLQRDANEHNLVVLERLAQRFDCVRVVDIWTVKPGLSDVDRYFQFYDCVARRGIYAFDAVRSIEAIGVEYLCVAAPANGVLVATEVPEISAIGSVQFADVEFHLGQRIVVPQ